MKNVPVIALALVFGLFLTACQTTQSTQDMIPNGKPLGGAAVTSLVSGGTEFKTFIEVPGKTINFTAELNADGSASTYNQFGKTAKGLWAVQDNLFCIKWEGDFGSRIWQGCRPLVPTNVQDGYFWGTQELRF